LGLIVVFIPLFPLLVHPRGKAGSGKQENKDNPHYQQKAAEKPTGYGQTIRKSHGGTAAFGLGKGVERKGEIYKNGGWGKLFHGVVLSAG